MSSINGETDAGSELPSLIELLPRRTAGRSRAHRASLSRRQIVLAAIELADAEGPEAISMRRIATRLGTGTMTLYGYVADRDALIAHMINEVVTEVSLPGQASGNWRADLELSARGLRDICCRHPWLPGQLGTLPFLVAPRLLAPAEFVLAALKPSGVDTKTSGAILRLLNNYVIGTTLREATDQPHTGTDSQAEYHSAMAAYLRQVTASGHYPLMSELGQALLDGSGLNADESFEIGLHCLLDGIGVLIAKQRSRQTR